MIRDKINRVITEEQYEFCGMYFNLYTDKDLFRIYNNITDKELLYETIINDYDETEEVLELVTQNAAKEELIKISDEFKAPLAVCFYLGKPKEIVEGPISARVTYGG